jgi:molybdate transport system substrate-binding protein
MRRHFVGLLAVFLAICNAVRAEEVTRVYAAASLTNALTDISAAWVGENHPQPKLVFAASSTLAKQIEANAPADIFAPADLKWMDYLVGRKKIAAETRVNLLGNTVVLVVPKGKRFPVELKPEFAIDRSFPGKLCMGEPSSVPAGIYGKQALQSLHWWEKLQPRVVGTDDVRTALAFVEHGECALGIVYGTDAAISDKVEVLASFPDATHDPVVYPFALVAGAQPDARAFLDYLSTSTAKGIFTRYGFIPKTDDPT